MNTNNIFSANTPEDQGPHVEEHSIVDFANLPVWCAWRAEPRQAADGTTTETKVPYGTVQKKSSSTDLRTWITADQAQMIASEAWISAPGALQARGGVGIFLGIDCGSGTFLGGLDLDSCLHAGVFTRDWAVECISRFHSYYEISPSGLGVKIFFRYRGSDIEKILEITGKLSRVFKENSNKAAPGIELHLAKRYFAITMDEFPGSPGVLRCIEPADIEWLLGEIAPAIAGNAVDAAEPSRVKPNGTKRPTTGALDNSRSARAVRALFSLYHGGIVDSYEEAKERMLQGLNDDPGIAEWMFEKGLDRNEREFMRAWEFVTKDGRELDRARREMAEADAEAERLHPEEEAPDPGTANPPDQEFAELLTTEIHNFFGSLVPNAVLTRDMLPAVIAGFAWDTAERMGGDPAALAMACLAVVSGATSDFFKVSLQAENDGWLEAARLWLALIGAPGTKKTDLMKAAMKPLELAEDEWRDQDGIQIEQWEEDKAEYDAIMKNRKKKSGDEGDNDLVPEKPVKPIQRRAIVQEFTMESLHPVLAENPRGVVAFQDELVEILAFDAYRANGVKKDRTALLRSWNGGRFAVDRKGDTLHPLLIHNWSAGLMGGTQPEKLMKLAPTLKDDGFLQRFLITPVLISKLPIDRKIDERAVKRYHDLVRTIANCQPHEDVVVRLASEADPYMKRIIKLAHDLSHMPGVLPALAEHANKLAGLFGRLVLTMHMADSFSRNSGSMMERFEPVVSERLMQQAYRVMVGYLVPNSIKMYETYFENEHQATQDVRDIAADILCRNLTKITHTDVQNGCRGLRGNPHKRRREIALTVLVDGYWLSVQGSTIQKTPAWNVNPEVHQRYAQQAAYERQQRELRQRQRAEAMQGLAEVYGHRGGGE